MSEPPVLASKIQVPAGFIGWLELNQPGTLNSLSLEMIDLLAARLRTLQQDPDCLAVYLSGRGERAFCAGGDIQVLYHSMLQGTGYCREFFAKEYRLDHQLRFFPLPVICAGHGAVMGGGLGLMSGSGHRLVTPSSKVALPEITIGLFPDASATFYLASMPGYLADFIALTGSHLTGQDAVQAGFADTVLAEEELSRLPEYLQHLDWQKDPAANRQLLREAFRKMSITGKSNLEGMEERHKAMDGILASQGPAAYLAALKDQAGDNPYLQRAANNLASGCPVTAFLIQKQLQLAADMDYSSMLRMEFNMAVACSEMGDFQEGVRALLIDRDRQPKWRFPDLSYVPEDHINAHFAAVSPHPLQDLEDA